MAQQKIVPGMTGRNATLVVFQDNAKLNLPCKTWNIKPNVTKHADGVNGENRDRLDVTLNYYEGTFEMYTTDLEVLTKHLEAQAVRDDFTLPLDQKGAVRFNLNDGTRKSFVLLGMVIDDFDAKNGGRNEKFMVTQSFRFTDLKDSKAV